jgi:excinuclease UvrABC ATPase subunit
MRLHRRRFSFNVEGGRCGVLRRRLDPHQMHFLPDIYAVHAQRRRYNREIEVR